MKGVFIRKRFSFNQSIATRQVHYICVGIWITRNIYSLFCFNEIISKLINYHATSHDHMEI